MPLQEQVGGAIAGGIMGLALGAANDSRQRKQQDRLNKDQHEWDKKMTDYTFAKQLQMWKDTNYGAQIEEMGKAGLNPALMYGMSGGGATTTGGGASSSRGANAPVGGGEAAMGIQAGMQTAMMEAQIKLAESQANKNNVEAGKIGGVDTVEAETRIKSLTAGITNTEAITALTKVETTLKQLDTVFQGESLEDRLDQVKWTAKRAQTELDNAQNTTYINKATRDEQIKTVQVNLIGAVLRNALTQQQTAESKQRVVQMSESIYQEWEKIAQGNTHNSLELLKHKIQINMNEWTQKHPGVQQVIGGGAEDLRNMVDKISEAIRDILQPYGTKK